MKIKTIQILFIGLFGLLFASCTLKEAKTQKKAIQKSAVYIDTISVSYTELDATVRQELFDELNRIYTIRKIAAEVLIKEKLLILGAKAKNITVKKMLENLYQRKVTDLALAEFSKTNNYSRGVSALERGLSSYDAKSDKGKKLILERLKHSVLKQYTDSLKTVYKVDILLKAPTPPVVKIDNLMTYYKGNLDSKVTFLQISDLECYMCREYALIFERLYNKYKDKVRFAFTQFGSYTSTSAIAAECAARQGKFWQMQDSIAFSKSLPELKDIYRIAGNLELDLNQFKKDFKSEEISKALETNFSILDDAGIYGTPTIMINDRFIYNSSSLESIEKMLIEEIEKTKS